MWDNLNTMFRQPGMSAIFADYQAAISLKVTGGQNPQVKIQQLNTLFKCLAVNGMSISDPMQGMILLNTLPVKWDSVGMVYLQSTCQLTNVSFQAMREVVMAEFECTMCSSTIGVSKILAVKRKGQSLVFSEQKCASNQAPPALVKPFGSQKKKWKGGKGKAWAHKIVSSVLIPQAIAKQLQETHHIALPAPMPAWPVTVVGGPSQVLAIVPAALIIASFKPSGVIYTKAPVPSSAHAFSGRTGSPGLFTYK